MDEHGHDFALVLSEIEFANRDAIKSTLDKLAKNPTPEGFWVLSRQIRLASYEDLKPLLDQIMKTVKGHRDTLVSAAFANAHLLRAAHFIGQNECYKWAKVLAFPENPLFTAKLYNILALPTFSNVLTPLYGLLDLNYALIQRNAAAAIARTTKGGNERNMLRRIISTFCETPIPDVQTLDLPPCTDNFVRLRGFLFVVEQLMANPIPVTDYLKLFLPILSKTKISGEAERTVVILVQKLLAKLMVYNPAAFHSAKIMDVAMIQYENKTLQTEFVQAIFRAYGIFGVQKFGAAMLPKWIGSASGFQFIDVLAPYSMFLDIDSQLELHKALIDRCRRRPFDEDLYETTTRVMMAAGPTESPHIGEFIELAQKSVYAQSVLQLTKALSEPRMPPIVHPLREKVKIKEIEKKDTFTQVRPEVKSVILQVDRTREISAKPPPPKAPVFIPSLNIPTKAEVKKETELNFGSSDTDSDLGLDSDAAPDSDETD